MYLNERLMVEFRQPEDPFAQGELEESGGGEVGPNVQDVFDAIARGAPVPGPQRIGVRRHGLRARGSGFHRMWILTSRADCAMYAVDHPGSENSCNALITHEIPISSGVDVLWYCGAPQCTERVHRSRMCNCRRAPHPSPARHSELLMTNPAADGIARTRASIWRI